MRTTLCFSWLVVAALLVPTVYANGPHLTDAQGDAPAALDVLSATWTTDRADRVQINIQLADLLVGQPLADGNPEETRWYYTAKFTPSTYGGVITVRCLVGIVETSTPVYVNGNVRGQTVTGDVGATLGTECRSTPMAGFNNRPSFQVNTVVDKTTSTLSIILTETVNPTTLEIGPGTTFSGLTLETAGGKVSNIGVGHKDTVYDTTGVGSDFTM
jgi:hypothetical protein